MKAIVQDSFGSPDVLELAEIEKPLVGDDSVCVRVRAASVNPLDWHLMRGVPYIARMAFGMRKPKERVRGVDLAGIVESVGKNVKGLRPGDEVFGSCNGAFADYACAEATSQGLRDFGKVQPGSKVLINGAAGGVGTFAVQLARSFGAEVTGVCSGRNAELVRSIGADHVIDYTQVDFTRADERYDVVLDNMYRSLSDCRRALTPEGTVVLIGGSDGRWINGVGRLLKASMMSPLTRQKMLSFVAQTTNEDMVVLKDLIEAGKVTPVVDRTYPLSETAEAIRYLEAGHARGKVVIAL
jgi:NADPH:quinone reductase-like Zn-dependent oxidoreductase